jgi:L-cysteate sulfo-lyase
MDLSDFTKSSFGFFPTPLIELKALSKHLSGPAIFMKRDDLTGLALGGNKTRKLEYLFGEALNKGCDVVVTGGAQQSNHCRQTAAAAAKAGLDCHLVLGGEKPDVFTGNLLLDSLFGATLHFCGDLRKGENIPEIFEQLTAQAKKPYIIPYGGSNVTGALGFVSAVEELQLQMEKQNLYFNELVFASSSGGTQAGLMVGKELFKAKFDILGIGIDKDEMEGASLENYILNLANQTIAAIDLDKQFSIQDVHLNNDYLGKGYGVVSAAEKEAIDLLARYEGILLDPVYTAKAMAGLIDLIRKGRYTKTEKVLFWHTGGAPALFYYNKQLQ